MIAPSACTGRADGRVRELGAWAFFPCAACVGLTDGLSNSDQGSASSRPGPQELPRVEVPCMKEEEEEEEEEESAEFQSRRQPAPR